MKIGRLVATTAAALLIMGACAPAAPSPTAAPAQPAQPAAAPAKQAEPKAEAKTAPKEEAKQAPAKPQQLMEVTVATAASGQAGYLSELIEAKGISAKHGLKVTNQAMNFTEAANALKLGRSTAASMQPTTAMRLKDEGSVVQQIAPVLFSGNAWIVREDAPYQTFADLKGQKIGNFSRVTGAYFFAAVIAKENGLDIENDFQNIPAETAALIALLERGEVEAINMFEPHVTRILHSGPYRVLVDFDAELGRIFGAPPIKSSVAVNKETVDKQPEVVKALQAAYREGVEIIKAGEDEDFFRANAKEMFGLEDQAEITAAFERNRMSYADQWGTATFEAQNKILQKGTELGLLPEVSGLEELWVDYLK